MAMESFSEIVLTEMRQLLAPLEEATQSTNAFVDFLKKFGVDEDLPEDKAEELRNLLSLQNDFSDLANLLTELEQTETLLEKAPLARQGYDLVNSIVDKINDVDAHRFASFPAPYDTATYWQDKFQAVFEDLLGQYLATLSPLMSTLLQVLGVVVKEDKYGFPNDLLHRLEPSHLKYFGRPDQGVSDLYNWGAAPIAYQNFFRAILDGPLSLGFDAVIEAPGDQIISEYYDPSSRNRASEQMQIPLFEDTSLILFPIPNPGEDLPAGFVLVLRKEGNTIFTDEERNFVISVTTDQPTARLQVFPADTALEVDAGDHFGLSVQGVENSRSYILGGPDTTNVSIQNWTFGAQLVRSEPREWRLLAAFDSLRISVSFQEADNFLRNNAGEEGQFVIDTALAIAWSNRSGLTFRGSAAFELKIPIHLNLGPVQVTALLLGVTIDEQIGLLLAADFSFAIGPLFISVREAGATLNLEFPENGAGGNLGFVNISDLEFKPPNGLGIAVTAGLIKGGGFILFDPPNHTYAGILQLAFQKIEIVGIGIIQTRLANNKPGFSMILSLSARFNPGFQLGYGFVLTGVGGLLGINRTTKVDVLRERVLGGSVDSIMFPENPLQNADRILGDLQAIFPPQAEHFVIAPFLQIGWGGPAPIITVELAVLLEFPFRGRIILIGSASIQLPPAGPARGNRPALVVFRIDVFGDINFIEQYMLFEGRLRDSYVVGLPMAGGFAFLIDWSNRPAFLLSLGGYHPRYRRPQRFPVIPRLNTTIRKGRSVTFYCEYYQTITSNTYQLGISANLIIKGDNFRVVGYLSFNALLEIDPLLFSLDISMGVEIKYKSYTLAGVSLHFNLRGPAPWFVKGYAKITIAKFIKVKVRFKHLWGRRDRSTQPVIAVATLLANLQEAIEAPGNWGVQLPPDYQMAELLRPIEELEAEGAGLVLHPGGFLEVRQNILPLQRQIELVGNARIQVRSSFSVTIDAAVSYTVRDLNAPFAIGQHHVLPNFFKLSLPDFTEMVAGFTLSAADTATDDLGAVDAINQYAFENIVLLSDGTIMPSAEAAQALRQLTATTRNIMSRNIEEPRRPLQYRINREAVLFFDTTPEVTEEESYQVVRISDLTPYTEQLFGDPILAQQAIERFIAEGVEEPLQVLAAAVVPA